MDLFEGDFDSRARKKYCNNKTNAVPRQEPAVSRKGHDREIVHDIDQISGMRALMCVEEGVQEENTSQRESFHCLQTFFFLTHPVSSNLTTSATWALGEHCLRKMGFQEALKVRIYSLKKGKLLFYKKATKSL